MTNSLSFIELLSVPNLRIERIVSVGHSSPPGYFYDQDRADQDRAEGVLVLQGSAKVLFEGEPELIALGRGDYMHIPPHVRHRVEWTSPDEPTVWLAIYWLPHAC